TTGAVSSLRRCDPSSVCVVVVVREPPAEGGDQRIQGRSRVHSGVFAAWHLCGGMRRSATLVRRRRTMQAPQAATKRSCAMPRLRRWEPNKRLVYERERRGWSQDEAAQEAYKIADRLGQSDLVFTGAQF